MPDSNSVQPTKVPDELQYSEDHEWVRTLDGGIVEIGITDYAQDALGDIVFVELPQQGATVAAAESMGEVESTKSVSDIFTPVSGTVVAINELLDETPELINSDPYGQGWICKIQLSDDNKLEQLLSSQQYAGFLGT